MPIILDVADMTLFNAVTVNATLPPSDAGVLSKKVCISIRQDASVFLRMTDVIYPHSLFLKIFEVDKETKLEFRTSVFSIYVSDVRVDNISEAVQAEDMQFRTFIDLCGKLVGISVPGLTLNPRSSQ